MSKVQAAIVSQDSITLVIDGHTTPITDSHHNYDEIRALAASHDYDAIAPLLDMVKAIVDFGVGRVTVEDGMVMYDGVATHNAVTTRIMQMVEEGLAVDSMIAFLDNLMENPSYRSVQQLYGFLEVNDLPITEDGCFLAYRMCTNDWKDHRTGTMDNSVGAVVSMPRNQVNEDPDTTCSAGLHVCAQGYLGFYGSGNGRTILVKVNPAHVVAVPSDYDNAKMRVCEFTVLQEVDGSTRGDVYTSAVFTPATDTNLADTTNVLTKDEAIVALGLQGTTDPKAALRKRMQRGTTCKAVFVGGVEMVQLIDNDAVAEAEADPTVMTHDEAVRYFDKQARDAGKQVPYDGRAALRKRLNRETTAKRVYPNGVEMVKILD